MVDYYTKVGLNSATFFRGTVTDNWMDERQKSTSSDFVTRKLNILSLPLQQSIYEFKVIVKSLGYLLFSGIVGTIREYFTLSLHNF